MATLATLAKLQSIPEEFAIKNPNLFGDSAESGNSGEPIKHIGNAVNVELVKVIAGVLSAMRRSNNFYSDIFATRPLGVLSQRLHPMSAISPSF